LFSQNTPTSHHTSNYFTKNSNNLFGNTNNPDASSGTPRQGLFGNMEGSIFSQEKKSQTNNEEVEEEDGDDADAPLEDVDEANPSLSTGKYDYIQT
jgi:hypothetical protein